MFKMRRKKKRKAKKPKEEKAKAVKKPTRKYLLIAIILVVIVVLIAHISFSTEYKAKKALIIDGLSIEFNNPEFINRTLNYLKKAGYEVDIFNGTDVTVDTYRNMFSQDYKLIILRIHSAPGDGIMVPKSAIVFFTTEKTATEKYFAEQIEGLIVKAKTLTRGESFYAVTPDFIGTAPGKLSGGIVIVLSCYGTLGMKMPETFIDKGATVYVGWDGEVSPEYMDEAGLALIKNLVINKLNVEEAVSKTMREIGPDPLFKSRLKYYPFTAGSYKLER